MPQLDRDVPPLSSVPDMFHDMTRKALQHGLLEALEAFKGRPVKVATMCSGTESPIFALDLIADSLRAMGLDFKYEHMFSAEITPFKQAFIQRNFNPPILFRDITQIKLGQQAETVFGAPKSPPPPGEVHVLIAGFACVDFSNLNNKKRTFSFDPDRDEDVDPGESSVTFEAIHSYASEFRPNLILLENITNAHWALLVPKWKEIGYAAQFIKLDTRNFYLPQIRTRGYMICINCKDGLNPFTPEAADVAINKWIEVVKTLQRPASSPIEDFLLKPDSVLLSRALSQMSEPKSAVQRGWRACRDRHDGYRQTLGLGDGTPYTRWESGVPLLPAYVRKDWLKIQPDRILDLLDVMKLQNALKGRDIEEKAVILDVSQNCDRNLDRVQPGLTGCITPSGIPFHSLLGRPLTGLEALALQGLPLERLHITSETQKNLQDLAGNAMTTTVVGAALLAAFAATPHILDNCFIEPSDNCTAALTDKDASTEAMGDSTRHGHHDGLCLKSRCNFGALEERTVTEWRELAAATKQLCHCESENTITTKEIFKCQDCKTTVCGECSGNPPHNLETFDPGNRVAPEEFRRAVSRNLPTRLRIHIEAQWFSELGGDGYFRQEALAKELATSIQECQDQELRFRSCQRGTSWTITYSSSRLKLILHINGSKAEWMLFASPAASEPQNSKLSEALKYPIARMRPDADAPNALTGSWEIRLPHVKERMISVAGDRKLVPSWRNELGLKKFGNEQVWSDLVIDGPEIDDPDARMDIDGVFKLLPLCGTPKRALHRRNPDTVNSQEETFLMFRSLPYRDGLDTMVVTSDIARLDTRIHRNISGSFHAVNRDGSHVSLIDEAGNPKSFMDSQVYSWEPSSKTNQQVLYRVYGEWVLCASATVSVPASTDGINKIALLAGPIYTTSTECWMQTVRLLTLEYPWLDRNPLGSSQPGTWWITESNQNHMSVDLKWLISRIPSLSGDGVSPWVPYEPFLALDPCGTCAPPRPELRWTLRPSNTARARSKKVIMPYEDGIQADAYEKAWKNRPSPIQLKISITSNGQDPDPVGSVEVYFNPVAIMHRAMALMPARIDAGPSKTEWRLDIAYDPYDVPAFPDFQLRSNQLDHPHYFAFDGTAGADGQPYQLRIEQARSLQWMLKRDSLLAPRYREEVLEECTSNILNWKLEARISRTRSVRGGILADQVGYGKTIMIIALAVATAYDAVMETIREASNPDQGDVPIPVKATCIVVPSTLVAQWAIQIRMFWPSCNLLVIHAVNDLFKVTISAVKEADIIVIPATLLLDVRYLRRVAELSGLPEPPRTERPREFQAWLSTALPRLERNISSLLQNGVDGFVDRLQKSYNDYNGDWVAYDLNPSKRYRGAQFQKQQAKKQQAAKQKTANDDQSQDPTPSLKPRDIKGFDVEHSCDATGVVLNMFRFHRKVVDEQTYVSQVELRAFAALQSRSSWLLSATPNLQDFVDVQRLARFLDVHLGSEDATAIVTTPRNLATVRADQTKVEEFEAFQSSHSASWHVFRTDNAQKFLDSHLRRNVVEHTEIKMVEHYTPIRLEPNHLLFYAITQAQLFYESQWRPKEVKNYATAQSRYLQELSALFDKDVTRHEALSRIASYDPWKDGSGDDQSRGEVIEMIDNCQALSDGILRQLNCHLTDMRATEAIFRNDGAETWSAVLDKALHCRMGGREASTTLVDLCTTSTNEEKHYHSLLALIPEDIYSDDQDGILKQDVPSPPKPVNFSGDIGRLNGHAEVLGKGKRTLGALGGGAKLQGLVCQDANQRLLRPDCKCIIDDVGNFLLSAYCGHTSCRKCYLGSQHQLCSARQCREILEAKRMILPHQLVSCVRTPTTHGAKMAMLIQIIQATTEQERVVVFSQFADVTDRISSALTAHSIKHYSVRDPGGSVKKMKKAQIELEAFKSNKPAGDPAKVLILNPADATAAGHNLTNAATVVFVSPLVASSGRALADTYTQAVGRCRRWGQRNTVHVHHLLAVQTHEVDVAERRFNVKLRLDHTGGGETFTAVAPDQDLDEGRPDLGSWAYRTAKLGEGE